MMRKIMGIDVPPGVKIVGRHGKILSTGAIYVGFSSDFEDRGGIAEAEGICIGDPVFALFYQPGFTNFIICVSPIGLISVNQYHIELTDKI